MKNFHHVNELKRNQVKMRDGRIVTFSSTQKADSYKRLMQSLATKPKRGKNGAK